MRAVCVLLIIGALSSVRGEDETLRAIEKCGRLSDLGTCLRLRAVTLLDRALGSGPLVINDYLSLAPSAEANSTQKSAEEIEASLPKDPEQKESALDDMIADQVTTFISSRSLRLNFPGQEAEGARKTGYGGGGGGGKKGGGMMMMLAFAGMFSWLVQMAFAKIALLAGKALLVGKMALLLSAVIGLKKLLGGDEGHDSHQVVYAQEAHHGGGHGWGRSAQELAYSGHLKGKKL